MVYYEIIVSQSDAAINQNTFTNITINIWTHSCFESTLRKRAGKPHPLGSAGADFTHGILTLNQCRREIFTPASRCNQHTLLCTK